jgi:HNH endonuclease
VGRRRRRPTAALRRAARERDKCRCRFPGCESRRVDLHHIQYWSNGGRTKLTNLISLCKYHHKLVHDRGYLIKPGSGDAFTFYRSDGAAIPASPALPPPDGTIEDCHDADITPGTIIPAWYGERLDLDHAIYVCLANAENRARRRDQAQQPGLTDQQHPDRLQPDRPQPDHRNQPDPFRPPGWVGNPFAWTAKPHYDYRLPEQWPPGPGDGAGAADRRGGPGSATVGSTG